MEKPWVLMTSLSYLRPLPAVSFCTSSFFPGAHPLHDKYLFPKPEADALATFLTPMLRLHPEKRAKASELKHHKWLEDIVVQGEINVIWRME